MNLGPAPVPLGAFVPALSPAAETFLAAPKMEQRLIISIRKAKGHCEAPEQEHDRLPTVDALRIIVSSGCWNGGINAWAVGPNEDDHCVVRCRGHFIRFTINEF
jgi:hypothetical protein